MDGHPKILENWLYWIVINAVSVWLFTDRGLSLTSGYSRFISFCLWLDTCRATHPGHPLAPISEALNAWQIWDQNWHARGARPDLGEVLGIGSANTVFSSTAHLTLSFEFVTTPHH